ncbi:MAG: DNA replication initiation protein [Rhizobiales bacterium]|nr:DNA replication initiation protein [Hyphomicrobiales bacterium]
MLHPVLHSSNPSAKTVSGRAEPERCCTRIVVLVAADFGVTAAEIWQASRGSPQAVFARQVAMYLAHTALGLNFAEVGTCFSRDRTTAAHACGVVEDRRDDIWFDCRIAALELSCRARIEDAR